MQTSKLFPVIFCLFDGGEGASTGEGTGNPAAAGQGTGETTILYGKQPVTEPPAAGESKGEETPKSTLEDRKKAYRELVEGEFKDLYTEDTQNIINRRFKDHKALSKQVEDAKPLLDMLAARYNVDGSDLAQLTKSVEEDYAYWASAADEAGKTVEEYMEKMKQDREIAHLRAVNKAYEERENAQRLREADNEKFAQWRQEEMELQKLYPDFSLAKELENDDFRFMISNTHRPYPLQRAYEAVHHDEIVAAQAKAAEKQVVDSIRARGARPSENGTTSQSAFQVRDDVSKLTPKDMQDIQRRVMSGERISFG